MVVGGCAADHAAPQAEPAQRALSRRPSGFPRRTTPVTAAFSPAGRCIFDNVFAQVWL
jgi:hypothetical protein